MFKLAQASLAQHRAVTAGVLSCCFPGVDKCPFAAAALCVCRRKIFLNVFWHRLILLH